MRRCNPGRTDPRASIYGKQLGRRKVSVISALTLPEAVRVLRKVLPGREKEAYAHMARRQQALADGYARMWSRVADKASTRAFGRKFQLGDYRISAIGREEFDERSKQLLRAAAVRGSQHTRIAAALKVLAGAKMRKVFKLNPLGRVAARGFVRVRRSATPQWKRNPSRRRAAANRRLLDKLSRAARANRRSGGKAHALHRSLTLQILAHKTGIPRHRLSRAIQRGIRAGAR